MMTLRHSILNKHNVIHFTVWMGYNLFLTALFYNFTACHTAFFRASFLTSLHALLFYFNSYILVPKLLDRKKTFLYILSILGFIILNLILISKIDTDFRKRLLPTPRAHAFLKTCGPPPYFFPKKAILKSHKVKYFLFRSRKSLVWIIIVYLASMLYVNRKKHLENEKKHIKLKGERIEAEMKFLKSQINPHFLFNALNNIYSLSRMQAPNTPEIIMKLSKMLRYNLYECNVPQVSLEQEINYIKNYVAFQQLKTEKSQNINLNIEQADPNATIAPLLLIPFIENSFKHSHIENTEKGWIDIHLETTDQKIQFTITNSIPTQTIQKDTLGGIGLENIKRRLELEYPNKYMLDIKKEKNSFTATLKLNRQPL